MMFFSELFSRTFLCHFSFTCLFIRKPFLVEAFPVLMDLMFRLHSQAKWIRERWNGEALYSEPPFTIPSVILFVVSSTHFVFFFWGKILCSHASCIYPVLTLGRMRWVEKSWRSSCSSAPIWWKDGEMSEKCTEAWKLYVVKNCPRWERKLRIPNVASRSASLLSNS